MSEECPIEYQAKRLGDIKHAILMTKVVRHLWKTRGMSEVMLHVAVDKMLYGEGFILTDWPKNPPSRD